MQKRTFNVVSRKVGGSPDLPLISTAWSRRSSKTTLRVQSALKSPKPHLIKELLTMSLKIIVALGLAAAVALAPAAACAHAGHDHGKKEKKIKKTKAKQAGIAFAVARRAA
jgi:uracil-DNA glycosylase